jgi:aromatic-L-amino-acid/L-tryptophan decarboxylase
VRDPRHLQDAFAHNPTYYEFGGEADDPPVNFFELGMQNSRGFRALKVWLGLRQAGRAGVAQSIADDCALARRLHAAVDAHRSLEARGLSLSIATFRYVPPDLDHSADGAPAYLDALNRAIVERLQAGGEAFVSNAVVDGSYLLRACIVNFRTTAADVDALPEIVARVGAETDAEMRPETLR